tara:strand:- start:5717 stop:6886 length:1170 start_codon:yes stop_codon:yes gene_type:complete
MDPLTLALLVATLVFAGIAAFLFFNRQSPKSAEESISSPEDLQKAEDAERDRLQVIVSAALTDAIDKLEKRNQSDFKLQSKHIESIQQTLDKSLETFKTEQSKYASDLVVNVKNLEKDTRDLSQALRSTKGSGQWGEMQLRRVVELAGMLEHCDFETQKRMKKLDGTIDIPDMIAYLPSAERRPSQSIAVDSKAPTTNFMAANDAKDERTREESLKKWKKDLRGHVADLSSKKYWENFKEPVELVVMFLPGEAMFSVAFQEIPELIEEATKQKVMLASPITLLSLLKTFAYGWRQVVLVASAGDIHETSKGLFNSLTTYTEHLNKMGKSLQDAVLNFNKAAGSWQRNVRPKGEKLLKLGVSTDSEEVLNLAEIDEPLREIDIPKTSDDS